MPIVMVLVMVFLSLTIRYCRFFICLAMIVSHKEDTYTQLWATFPLSQKVPYILHTYTLLFTKVSHLHINRT